MFICNHFNIYYSKSRIRRSEDGAMNVGATKNQDSTNIVKPLSNFGVTTIGPSSVTLPEATGSAKGQKNKKIETVTFGDNLNDKRTLWETVDQEDTVINKTFDEHIDKKANQTWRVMYTLGLLIKLRKNYY